MLVPAPFIHPVIGRSSSSSVMFHAWFILLLICNGLKGGEEYCSIRIFQCLYFLQRLLFSSGRKVLLALMCEAERWDLQHLAVQETPTVMVRLCLWRVHLLLHLSLKGDHPSVSVTLASYCLISVLLSSCLQKSLTVDCTYRKRLLLWSKLTVKARTDAAWNVLEKLLITDQSRLGKSRFSSVEIMHHLFCLCLLMCMSDNAFVLDLSVEHQNMSL